MSFKKVLVVCVGNICRSPIAEYLIKKQNLQLEVSSAGIAALAGHPADEKAKIAAQNLGLDLSQHIAKQLTTHAVAQAELILVMSTRQQRHIEQTWTSARGKPFRLGHWQDQNISDPFQQDQDVFNKTSQLIALCVADWTQKFN